MERLVNTVVLLMAAFLLSSVLWLPTARADAGEFPTGLANECGVRGIMALHIQQAKLGGVTRNEAISGFLQWTANVLENAPADSLMASILAAAVDRFTPEGYMVWIAQVYDSYDDPGLALQKERLYCEKAAAGEPLN